jgi:hypothetical protein
MNITNIINTLPTPVRSRVYMALLASMNSRIFTFARLEFQALKALGLIEALSVKNDLDRNNAVKLVREARIQELDADDATTQARDNGNARPRNWIKEAEPYALLKDVLVGMYADFCQTTHQRMTTTTLSSHTGFLKEQRFTPNIAAAKSKIAASAGRFTLEQAIEVQRREFDVQRRDTINNSELILAIAEDIAPGFGYDPEHEIDHTNLDAVLDELNVEVQLSFVNSLWRKLNGFFDTSAESRGFLSSRYRSDDVAGDMSFTSGAIDDVLRLGQELLDQFDEHFEGKPDAPNIAQLGIVDAIARAKTEAAKAKARPLALPTKPGTDIADVVEDVSASTALADAFRKAVA